MALLTDDIGDALERLCGLREIILPTHGFQSTETLAESPYVVGINSGHGLDKQRILTLRQEIVLYTGNEKFIQFHERFGGGQLPLPIAVQLLCFHEKLLTSKR